MVLTLLGPFFHQTLLEGVVSDVYRKKPRNVVVLTNESTGVATESVVICSHSKWQRRWWAVSADLLNPLLANAPIPHSCQRKLCAWKWAQMRRPALSCCVLIACTCKVTGLDSPQHTHTLTDHSLDEGIRFRTCTCWRSQGESDCVIVCKRLTL